MSKSITPSPVNRAILAFVVVTALFAGFGVLSRFLDSGFTVLQQVYLRVFAALMLATVVFWRSLDWSKLGRISRREWGILAMRGFFAYGVAVTLSSKAATMTTISNLAFIAALPFTPMLGMLLFKERVGWPKAMLLLGTVAGVYILAIEDPRNLLSLNLGDAVAMAAALGFALTFTTRRLHSNLLNNQEITVLSFAFGGLFVGLMSWGLGEGLPPIGSSGMLWLGVALGGLMNIGTLFLGNYGFQHLDAVRGGNLMTLQTVWGVALGLIFFGEIPDGRGAVGGVIIVSCVIGMNSLSRAKPSLKPVALPRPQLQPKPLKLQPVIYELGNPRPAPHGAASLGWRVERVPVRY